MCGQVACKEDCQGNLGNFAGLEGTPAEPDPNPCAVDFGTKAGNKRHDKQDEGEHQRNIGDLTQHSVIPQEVQHNGAEDH